MSSAKRDAFVVDPYMDDTVLTDFGGTLVDGVTLRLLTDQATVKPSLAPPHLGGKLSTLIGP